MDAALLEIESENPLTYTFDGIEYPCSRGDVTSAQNLGMGGYAQQADLVLVVRKSAVADPGLKGEITVGATAYLVDQIVEDPNGVFQVWSLSDPNKGT